VTRRLLYTTLLLVVLPGSLVIGQHQFQRGLTWEDNRYNTLPVNYGSLASLPAAHSLKHFYPRVISQPHQDYTGVAWACVWNGRTASEAIACNTTDPAKVLEVAFSPAYNYALVRKGNDCKESISVIDLLESMTKNGSPFWSEYREFCAAQVSPEVYPLARAKRLSGYTKIFNTSDAQDIKIQSVKQALLAHNPVLAGMICPPSFQLAQEFWQPREPADAQYGGHVVSVVGYDDTKFGGAFEVLNTWGKDWGVQGYSWIRYKDFAEFTPYGFSLFQVGSAACTLPLEGEVVFKDITGKAMPGASTGDGEYQLAQSYPTGTEFTIIMNSSRPAYVYSFGVDPTNTYFTMFPRSPSTLPISFAPLKAPDDMPLLNLTDPPGRNVIYFVFSPTQIDINTCINLLKIESDASPRKIEAVLSMGPSTGTQWQSSRLAFRSSLVGPVAMKVVLNQK
jgi:hypothetical protein